jgi:hypothetical protein
MEPRQLEIQESCNPTVDGSTSSGSPAAERLKPVEEPSYGEECPICLVQEVATFPWKETSCGHRFHGRCVERWLEMKGSCPICRCRCQLPIHPPVAAEQVYQQHPDIFTVEQVYQPRNLYRVIALEFMDMYPELYPDRHNIFNDSNSQRQS